MATTKYKNILSVLEQYYNELKSYSDILKHLAESTMILGHELKERDKLREILVRKTGMLKPRIIEVTGKQYYEQFMSKYDMWNEAFNPSGYLPFNQTALAFCITATNEAIGKLEDDINKGKRDKHTGELITTHSKTSGKVIEVPPEDVLIPEPPKVFIAHGGESQALDKVCKFFRALGVEPIVVEETASQAKSVDQNVQLCLERSNCALILATKGDIDAKTGDFIPKGNVLIEVGRCQERFPDKTIYLLEEGAKYPTNISEKVWERFIQDNMEKAFLKIVRELVAFGFLKAAKGD